MANDYEIDNFKQRYIRDYFLAWVPTVVFNVLGLMKLKLNDIEDEEESLYLKMHKQYYEAIQLYNETAKYNDAKKAWEMIENCFLVLLEMEGKVSIKPIITDDDFQYNIDTILKNFGIVGGIDDALRGSIDREVKNRINSLMKKARDTKTNKIEQSSNTVQVKNKDTIKDLNELDLLRHYVISEIIEYKTNLYGNVTPDEQKMYENLPASQLIQIAKQLRLEFLGSFKESPTLKLE